MNKKASIIVTLALIVAIGIIFVGNSKSIDNNLEIAEGQNVEIVNGVQYITINASGGYFPRVSSAEAGIPTKIVMNTKGTYDCSAALVIQSLGYKEILPQNGSTEIDAGVPVAGVPIQGVCSMGMYSFQINFI